MRRQCSRAMRKPTLLFAARTSIRPTHEAQGKRLPTNPQTTSPSGTAAAIAAIMPRSVAIFGDYAAIMSLISFYDPLFHVKHAASVDQVRDIRLEGRHPELRRNATYQLHQPRQILTIEFRGRIVQQKG